MRELPLVKKGYCIIPSDIIGGYTLKAEAPSDTTERDTRSSSRIDTTIRLADIIALAILFVALIGTIATLFMVIKSNSMQAIVDGALDVRMLTSEDISNRDIAAQLDQIMEAVKGDSAASLMDKAILDAYILQRSKRFKEAINKWHSIANIAERHDKHLAANAFFSAAYIHAKMLLDHKEAIINLTKAINLMPGYADAYNHRGVSKMALKDFQGANNDLEIAVSINTNYAIAYSNLGQAKLSLGDHNAAITNYTKAININKELAEAYFNRGIVYAELGDINLAKKDLRDASNLAHLRGDELLKKMADGWLQHLGNSAPQDGSN